jgi:hypothetical protein
MVPTVNLTLEELSVLEYVYDQAGRDTRRNVDVRPIGGLPVVKAAVRLDTAGLLESASWGSDFCITLPGIEAVEEVRRRRSDRPARAAALRLALITWLYGHYVDGTTPKTTEEFLGSDDSCYVGEQFTANEVAQAVVYLSDKGLIKGISVDQTVHLMRPELKDKGVDCAESGKPVSEFLKPQVSGPTFHVQIDGSQNVVVGTQSDFTLNNTSGVDPAVLAQIMHFATLGWQSLPGCGLDEQQQAVAEQLSEEIEAEASSQAPDRGRLRQLTDRLVEAVAPAAGTALGGMVTALGQQAIAAIS